MEKEKNTEQQEELALTPENKKRLILFTAAAVLMFFVLPLLLGRMPEVIRVNGLLLLMMIFNQIFIGVVGWQSNRFPSRYSVWIPLAYIVLYAVSELVLYKQIGWGMEINYLQTGYICYFLKKFIGRAQKQQQMQQNKPFPKGVRKK